MQHHKTLNEALMDVRDYSNVIVRVETLGVGDRKWSHYRVYSDISAVAEAIVNSNEKEAFHEVTRMPCDNFCPVQRLYFDIDLASKNWGNRSPRDLENIAIEQIKAGVKTWLDNNNMNPHSALVASSSDYETKVSLHIVFPTLCFKYNTKVKSLAMYVKDRCEPWLANAIDTLYKPHQGLRLLGSRKCGTDRFKIIHSGPWPKNEPTYASTIHVYDASNPKVYDAFVDDPQVPTFTDVVAPSIQNAMIELDRQTGASCYDQDTRSVYERGIHIIGLRRRMGESYCIQCKRTHGSIEERGDNAYISIKNGVYYFNCYRNAFTTPKKYPVYLYTDIACKKEIPTKVVDVPQHLPPAREEVKRTSLRLIPDFIPEEINILQNRHKFRISSDDDYDITCPWEISTKTKLQIES
jgi:hypothetical protein